MEKRKAERVGRGETKEKERKWGDGGKKEEDKEGKEEDG